MKKKIVFVTVSSALFLFVLCLTGCFLFTPLPMLLGGTVKVDSDTGHFEEELVYTYAYGSYYYEYTFSTNGLFDLEVYWWDSTEEMWVLDDGTEGSYSWNEDTLLLELEIDREYDWTTSSWDDPAYCPYTETFPAYFTDQSWYGADQVLVLDETNDRNYIITYSYSDAAGDQYLYTVTVWIANDSVGASFEVFVEEVSQDTTGTTDKDETEQVGNVLEVYPEGGTWKKGDILTYYVEVSVSSRDWNPDTGWGDWTDSYQSRQTWTFLNMGDFIIYNPTTNAARKLMPWSEDSSTSLELTLR